MEVPDPWGDGGEAGGRSSLLPGGFKPSRDSNSLNIPFTVSQVEYRNQYREKGPLREFPLYGPQTGTNQVPYPKGQGNLLTDQRSVV